MRPTPQPTAELHRTTTERINPMNIKNIIAGGPVAILAAGGGVMWATHELHYLLRPSVIETLAGIATVGGGIAWAKSKGKAPAEEQEHPTVARATIQQDAVRRAQALPPAQSQQVVGPYVTRKIHQMHHMN
jgi:hypothetical protein